MTLSTFEAKALVWLGARVEPNEGVAKEEMVGIEIDLAARTLENLDSTEEMMKKTRLSLTVTVPLVVPFEPN